MAASIGLLNGVSPQFKTALDIPHAGVLLALPALLANGLLAHAQKFFTLPKGYYRLDSLFLLMAFMALARVKNIEALRYDSPGEWGKLLGLDRIAEAKTLRDKIGLLSDEEQPAQWAAMLCYDWMKNAPESAGTRYIDGHVRVYHGHQTQLPRHYVTRQKLCLRATTDYWVNAMDGQPFFVVNQAIDPGMIKVIEHEIVPQLKTQVPHKPNANERQDNPLLHRFVLVFDREGYSPDFMLRIKAQHIACQTYHKYLCKDWAVEGFSPRNVTLVSGNVIEMKLAERGTLLANKIWAREIRKLGRSGRQNNVLSANYVAVEVVIAATMFARWTQENFFKYMRENYSLDALVDCSTENIPDTTPVINPVYRRLDGEVRKEVGRRNQKCVKFAALILEGDIEPRSVEAYQQDKADLQEEIEQFDEHIEALKASRKGTKNTLLSESYRRRSVSTD